MRKVGAFAILAAMLMAAFSSYAQNPSVHQMPAGTVLRDKFVLVGKTVPLPEGDFVLVAKCTANFFRTAVRRARLSRCINCRIPTS